MSDIWRMVTMHPLKAWREANGVTLTQLSEKAGVLHTHLSMVENGKRSVSLKTGMKIVAATGGALTLEDLAPSAAEATQ